MSFSDRVTDIESESSSLITYHPTETGNECRRWPQFRILNENNVDLDELTCSKGDSTFLCV
jgi:hypothetical protein